MKNRKNNRTFFGASLADLVKYGTYVLTQPTAIVNIVALLLLLLWAPSFSILWLLVSTLFFLYFKNYRSILKIWTFTISVWYLLFTNSLSDIPILIGGTHTKVILLYLLKNDIFLRDMCMQTIYLLDFLSAKLGFLIYIPSCL